MDTRLPGAVRRVAAAEEESSLPLAGSRVVLVCAHFTPELGYQEVDLAKAFTRLGAAVRVVTSTAVSLNARSIVSSAYAPGRSTREEYEVVRLAPLLTIGANVLGCDARSAVAEFEPDYTIVIGPGKLFGLGLFSDKTAPWRRIAIIQDNSEDGRARLLASGRRRSRKILHRLIKQPAYRRVVRHADRVVLNVPETREIVGPWLSNAEHELFARRALDLRLGFDPERFFFDLEGRQAWRDRYRVRDDELLLGTCTRATPAKRLEDVISSVSTLRREGLAVRYVAAGLLDDAYGTKLRRLVAEHPDRHAIELLPIQRHDQMRELFSACDLGFWPRAAITIQQAMGTGLPVILRNRPTVNHLLSPPRNGWYIGSDETLEDVLPTALVSVGALTVEERRSQRSECSTFNRGYLSYDNLALEILAGLE